MTIRIVSDKWIGRGLPLKNYYGLENRIQNRYVSKYCKICCKQEICLKIVFSENESAVCRAWSIRRGSVKEVDCERVLPSVCIADVKSKILLCKVVGFFKNFTIKFKDIVLFNREVKIILICQVLYIKILGAYC